MWEIQGIKATKCPLVLFTPNYEGHLLYFLNPGATFNYEHLEAIVKASKRQYGEGYASYEDNDNFHLEKRKESNFKHTQLAHGVITLSQKTRLSIYRWWFIRPHYLILYYIWRQCPQWIMLGRCWSKVTNPGSWIFCGEVRAEWDSPAETKRIITKATTPVLMPPLV